MGPKKKKKEKAKKEKKGSAEEEEEEEEEPKKKKKEKKAKKEKKVSEEEEEDEEPKKKKEKKSKKEKKEAEPAAKEEEEEDEGYVGDGKTSHLCQPRANPLATTMGKWKPSAKIAAGSQKRGLLWGSKSSSASAPAASGNTHAWQAMSGALGSSDKASKFMRLMGRGAAAKEPVKADKMAANYQQEMFDNMQNTFQKGLQNKGNKRGLG